MNDFETIYVQYFPDVYRYALALTRNEAMAEELTQETFFKALRGIDGFDGQCKLYVWLCQIVKNTYFTQREKEKRYDRDADWDAMASGGGLEQRLLNKEAAFALHKSLHQLDEPYKEVFSLRLFGELSYGQIGALFGKTET